MAITGQTDSDIVQSFTTNANPTAQFAASVAAGSFLVCLVSESADETTTINSLGDGTNTWTLLAGPIDHANTTLRTWSYYVENAQAGQHTVTVALSAAISGRIALAEFTSDGNTPELDVFDASPPNSGSAITDHVSDSLAASAARAGAVIGMLGLNSSVAISSVGTNEIDLTAAGADRAHITYEPFAAGGTYTLEDTMASTVRGIFHSLIILEAAGGGPTAFPHHYYAQMRR